MGQRGSLGSRAGRRAARLAGVAAITALAGIGGFAPTGTAAGGGAFDIFQGGTEAAPIRAGAGIPLEVFFKIGGSEAQVLQDPVARGAGMLVDTRITQLASLIAFGTVPAPPIALPSPTVAETIWTKGSASPQTADASVVPAGGGAEQSSGGSAPVTAKAGHATAEAADGPQGAGHAAYSDLALSPVGVKDAVRLRDTASESLAKVTAEAVETSSTSVATGVSLLGGTITIDSIHSSARALSTGRPGQAVAEGSFEMGRVTALGKEAEITPDGIRIIDTSLPVPLRDAFNKQLKDGLAAAGVTIRMVPPVRVVKDDGSFASIQSAGVYMQQAAAPARSVNPLVGDLSLNLTLGFASADASATESSAFRDPLIGDTSGTGLQTVDSNGPLGTTVPTAGGGHLPGADAAGLLGASPDQGGSSVAGFGGGDSTGTEASMGTDTGTPTSSAPDSGLATGRFVPSGLAAHRRVTEGSDWWALAFVLLLAGFATVIGLQALPRLVRAGPPR